MNYLRALLSVPFFALLSCSQSDSIRESDSLNKMVGKKVLITTNHPVAVSVTEVVDPPSVTTHYDTASYLRGELLMVDSSGLVLVTGGGGTRIWIGRDLVVSVVTTEPTK